MNDTPRKTTVTLEDLLRVKRAEQPPAEFWSHFEHGLRTKQLAAIVEPRPWWAPFIRIGARVSRFQLPVGATAILAITLFTLREYQPVSPNSVFEPVPEMASASTSASVENQALAVMAVDAPSESRLLVATPVEPAPATVAVESRKAAAAPALALGAASHVAMIDAELSSARYMADRMADNVAAAQRSDSKLDQMLGRSLRSADDGSNRREPLAQINVPGDSKMYRWQGALASAASVGTGDSALRMNEQAAKHLNARRLSESDVISRLDVGGNRLTVKF